MTKVSAIFWHWTANMRHSLQTSPSDDDHDYQSFQLILGRVVFEESIAGLSAKQSHGKVDSNDYFSATEDLILYNILILKFQLIQISINSSTHFSAMARLAAA